MSCVVGSEAPVVISESFVPVNQNCPKSPSPGLNSTAVIVAVGGVVSTVTSRPTTLPSASDVKLSETFLLASNELAIALPSASTGVSSALKSVALMPNTDKTSASVINWADPSGNIMFASVSGAVCVIADTSIWASVSALSVPELAKFSSAPLIV